MSAVNVLAVMEEMYGVIWRAHGNRNIAVNLTLDRAEQARDAVAEIIADRDRLRASLAELLDTRLPCAPIYTGPAPVNPVCQEDGE